MTAPDAGQRLLRTGIAYSSLFAAVSAVVQAWVSMRADGVLVLGTVCFVVFLWACGVFTRAFWMADAGLSARLSAVDEDIRFADDVRADIARLESRD